MKNDQFQVSIRGAQRMAEGIAFLSPGTKYWVELKSEIDGHATIIVDDVIVVDGIAVKERQALGINRPRGTKGSFTFGFGRRSQLRSLVKVKFTPDKKPASGFSLSWTRNDGKDSNREEAVMPTTTPKWNGATTLRGKSRIVFGGTIYQDDAGPEPDHENAVNIELQLVAA